jgi:hypothetical protein
MIPARVLSQDMPLKSIKEPPKHSTTKAAVFSAVLPGLGQAYNKKYWKIPIIYAVFAVFGYFAMTYNKEFQTFKEAYIYIGGKYTQAQLKDGMDFYERNRDLNLILGGLWYILNIMEAYVDAHFFNYDISDDISMHISPSAVSIPASAFQPAPGIKISFKF